jgi:YVTN family beta-propeller protein
MRRLSVVFALVAAAAVQAQRPGLIVLNKSAGTASIISLDDGKTIATVPVGEAPHEVAVSPDGLWAIAANYGTGPAPGRTLTLIDLRSRQPVRTIDMGEYLRPHGIEWLSDGKHVLVTSEAARVIVTVDVSTGKVDRVIRTNQPGHLFTLSRDEKRLWSANIGSHSVSLVDFTTGDVIKTVPSGASPEANDVSPDGKELWVADGGQNRITIMNAATLDSLAGLPAGGRPNRLHFTPDGRTVLVSNINSGTLLFYDARRRQLVDSLAFRIDAARPGNVAGSASLSAAPEGILLSPDGRRAWIALAGADRLAEIDLATRKVARYITTGAAPDGMAYLASLP